MVIHIFLWIKPVEMWINLKIQKFMRRLSTTIWMRWRFILLTKKFYAVRVGRKTGIFRTWDDCRAQVEGFGGARYKGFLTEAEAHAWLGEAQPLSALFAGKKAPAARRAPLRASDAQTGEVLEDDADLCHVYTDGSCLRNPNGPGGWAVCIVRGGEVAETLSGGDPSTTNNRMEMTAAIEALRHLPKHEPLVLSTDSQYLKNGITKWIFSWKRRGWKKADGSPVLNQELWQALDSLIDGRRIIFRWVKGHAGHKYNEICDMLAKKEAQSFS